MKTRILAEKYREYNIKMRRDFHMYPEASWQEHRTSKKIQEELTRMGIPYSLVDDLGIVGIIEGRKKGKLVALRADMDALQLEERNNLVYKSKNPGLMHACGHDGHMSMLLTAAKILNHMKDQIKGSVKLIFQPAEELAQGAEKIIRAGIIDDVDNIFGIHLWNGLERGQISVEAGPRMASSDIFKITIRGLGGHGSLPHEGVDAILAASSLVMNLQSVVSREISPLKTAVVSIGKFTAGTRFNIIAQEAVLEGTTRCFDPETRADLPQILERIVSNTAQTYRAEGLLEYTWGTGPTINHLESAQLAAGTVEKLYGRKALASLEKITGAEDFAMYLEKIPGALALLGSRNDQKGINHPHHHEKFNIDEEALVIGSALYAQYALDFLNKDQ